MSTIVPTKAGSMPPPDCSNVAGLVKIYAEGGW